MSFSLISEFQLPSNLISYALTSVKESNAGPGLRYKVNVSSTKTNECDWNKFQLSSNSFPMSRLKTVWGILWLNCQMKVKSQLDGMSKPKEFA